MGKAVGEGNEAMFLYTGRILDADMFTVFCVYQLSLLDVWSITLISTGSHPFAALYGRPPEVQARTLPLPDVYHVAVAIHHNLCPTGSLTPILPGPGEPYTTKFDLRRVAFYEFKRWMDGIPQNRFCGLFDFRGEKTDGRWSLVTRRAAGRAGGIIFTLPFAARGTRCGSKGKSHGWQWCQSVELATLLILVKRVGSASVTFTKWPTEVSFRRRPDVSNRLIFELWGWLLLWWL